MQFYAWDKILWIIQPEGAIVARTRRTHCQIGCQESNSSSLGDNPSELRLLIERWRSLGRVVGFCLSACFRLPQAVAVLARTTTPRCCWVA